jgi:hypothetical protein
MTEKIFKKEIHIALIANLVIETAKTAAVSGNRDGYFGIAYQNNEENLNL